MPELSLPEVRLKHRLPEGLRDMTLDDIQIALPEGLRDLDMGREVRRAGQAADKAARKAAKAADKATTQAGRQAERMARDARKAAEREASRAAKAAGRSLPRRGPNPVPIAVLAMLGGALVGWILATSPTTGPRISGWLEDARLRLDEWRSRRAADQDEEWDTAETTSFAALAQSTAEPEAWRADSGSGSGVAVGPGRSQHEAGLGASPVGGEEHRA